MLNSLSNFSPQVKRKLQLYQVTSNIFPLESPFSMDIKGIEHLRGRLSELVNETVWSTSCITVPLENGVFGQDDIEYLEAIPDEKDRILAFYELFMTKKNSYQILMTTFDEGCQSGAVEILNQLDANTSVPGSSNSQSLYFEEEASSQLSLGRNECPVSGSSDGEIAMGVLFDVIKPDRLFTGRVRELEELHVKLQQSKCNSDIPTMSSYTTLIVGLGGIGKTELARKYIEMYGEHYHNNVIWICGDTEETMRDSFRRLAFDYLDIPLNDEDMKDKPIEKLVKEVYDFFQDEKSLFVFDNAESNENIIKFMPLQAPFNPYVLITTRDKHWRFRVEMLELNQMEELEAMKFVKEGLEILDFKQDHLVWELVKTLQFFPLAISQAISYIEQQQTLKVYSIYEYLKRFKSRSEMQLNWNLLSAQPITYANTMFTTLKMIVELLSKNKDCGKVAIDMLNMIAYFQPDEIPIKLLIGDEDMEQGELGNASERGILSSAAKFLGISRILSSCTPSQIVSRSEKFERALQLLVNFSIVRVDSTMQTISIHRLVQEITRIELRSKKMEKPTLKNILKLLSGQLRRNDLNTIGHSSSAYKYCEAYKKLVAKFKNLPWEIVEIDRNHQMYDIISAIGIGTELVETLEKHVSSNDIDLVRLKYKVMMANFEVENYETASTGFEQIFLTYLEAKAGQFTETEIFNVQYLLALCLEELSKRTESLKMFLQAYVYVEESHGLNYNFSMQVLLEIAEGLQELDYFRNPFVANEEYYKKKKILPKDLNIPEPLEILTLLKAYYANKMYLENIDSNYASSMFGLANFFGNIGDYDTATSIANDIHEQGRNSSDKEFKIQSINCLILLGFIKYKEGKREEALDIFIKAHAFSSIALGDSHELTLISESHMCKLADLGQSYATLGGLCKDWEILMTGYQQFSNAVTSDLNFDSIVYH